MIRTKWKQGLGTVALGLVLAGVAGCTRPTDEPTVPEVDSGPGAPLSEAQDSATEEALRQIAQATNDALREADSEPAPTNAMSIQGTPGQATATMQDGDGDGSATEDAGDIDAGSASEETDDADAFAPDAPDASRVALYEPTWANSDADGLVAAVEGRIGRPALIWFHADW